MINSLRYLLKKISYLSFKKISNAFLIVSSFYYSRITRNPEVWGKPLSISIEPTTSCNLRCPECPSGLRSFTRDKGNLKQSFFIKMLDQISDYLISITFYFQGEPFINPQFLDMVDYAHKKKIYTISSTNGHFLNDENCKKTIRSGLDELIVSVDGAIQETYEKYRIDGNLAQVLQGIKNLAAWKKNLKSVNPKIVIQFLVVQHNEHEIQRMHEICSSIGANELKLKSAQVYNYKNGNDLIPENEKYSRYIKNSDGSYSVKHNIENECWKMWHSAVITWDGLLVPCCFDKDATHKMGDLKSHEFTEVWHSNDYNNFRNVLFTNRKQIEICKNCTEGCQVWV